MSSENDYYMKMLEQDPEFDKWLCGVALKNLSMREDAKEKENE